MLTKHQLILMSAYNRTAREVLSIDDSPWYIPEETKIHLLRKYGYRCCVCGRTSELEIDHVIPISKGGKCHIDNLQVLCSTCNRIKSDHYLHRSSYDAGYVIVVPTITEETIAKRVLDAVEDILK